MKADLARIPKPYMPKVLWRDGKFVPNPHLQGNATEKGEKESGLNSQVVMKECNSLMTVLILFLSLFVRLFPHYFFSLRNSKLQVVFIRILIIVYIDTLTYFCLHWHLKLPKNLVKHITGNVQFKCRFWNNFLFFSVYLIVRVLNNSSLRTQTYKDPSKYINCAFMKKLYFDHRIWITWWYSRKLLTSQKERKVW